MSSERYMTDFLHGVHPQEMVDFCKQINLAVTKLTKISNENTVLRDFVVILKRMLQNYYKILNI